MAIVGQVFAENGIKSLGAEETNAILSGYGAIESGQIVKGVYISQLGSAQLRKLWLGHGFLNVALTKRINEHLAFFASMEGRLWYNSVPFVINPDVQDGFPRQNVDFYFPSAAGVLSFGRKDDPYLSLTIGRFEYKYDPQARTFGEYLFRAGCYPGYIISEFDHPLASVNGLKTSIRLFDFLHQDILLTTMHDMRPYFDFSLAYMANVSAGNAFSFGAGISFDNLISTELLENSGTNNFPGNGYLTGPGDSLHRPDSAYYANRGTKIIGHFSFDPKFGSDFNHFLGKDDLEIYAEAAVLGIRNYPRSNKYADVMSSDFGSDNMSNAFGYENIMERIPVMIGINLPTQQFLSYCIIPAALAYGLHSRNTIPCGIAGLVAGIGSWLLDRKCKTNTRLDLISLETEWYGSRYSDNYDNLLREGWATPVVKDPNYDYSKDDWKWSIYAKRTIFERFSLIGMIARDHFRTEIPLLKYQYYGEALPKPDDWYWMLKMKYDF